VDVPASGVPEKEIPKEEPSRHTDLASSAQTPITSEEAIKEAQETSSAAQLTLLHEAQDELVRGYAKSIQKRISRAIAYPFEAKEKGWGGTVKLTLHLLKDGSLADITVKESSGYTIFDRDALNTAKTLAPYEPFPARLNLNELMITAPIVYSQKAFSKDNSKAAGSASPFIPSGITYSELVQRRIANAIVYPEEARQYGWEGTVKLALHILSDGTLVYAAVKESSGHKLFDESALQAAKNSAPYAVFPPDSDLQELNVTVPIVYSLEKK
jgi:TonB family protein